MGDDRELWARADEMIRLHGDEAHAQAAWNVNRLYSAGDYQGAAEWQRVLERIRELQKSSGRPPQ